jgi:anti-sigma factor ChrR (cupin superfamily)
MPCKNLRGQLSLYACGDLDPVRSEAVRDHVANCPTCRLQVSDFQKSRSLLGSYGQEISRAQGRDVSSGVMGRVQTGQFRRPGHPGPQA